MINIALGRHEASEASKPSGKWHVARGRRHKAVMHEAAACCCLEADTTKERDRERGRERGSREGGGIDKTGAELDTPLGGSHQVCLGLGKGGNRERGEQRATVHALPLRRDYVKKLILTNDVADILCRVHCPSTRPPPHTLHCCILQCPAASSHAVWVLLPPSPCWCCNARVLGSHLPAYVCHGCAPLWALPNELLFASATIDNGIMTCEAMPPLPPPRCQANCSVIILPSFAKWTRLNKSSDRGQLYDKSNCEGNTWNWFWLGLYCDLYTSI